MISMLSLGAVLKTRAPYLAMLLGAAGLLGAHAAAAQSNAPDSAVYRVPVLVGSFELDSVGPKPKAQERPGEGPQRRVPGSPPVYDDTDVPSAQAQRLTEFFTVSLLQALNKKGFSATRQENRKTSTGALIRGVFAETDTRNRIRRGLLGSGSPNPRFFLYVGIFNLAREEQTLYQLAPTQSPNDRYGPVIALNAYIPMEKYELDKNPSEEDVKKICDQIADSLASLLASNPDAFSK